MAELTLGKGQMISGFEKAVVGMKVGESKTVTIPAEEAYGKRHEDLVTEVPREELPEGLDLEVGRELKMVEVDGSISKVAITKVTETSITLDGNHPLAGKSLTFEIKLVAIIE